MNNATPLRVFDYYSLLDVSRTATIKELKAQFNTNLIYQSPRMQSVYRQAYAVLVDPEARSILDDLLQRENANVVSDPNVVFVPSSLAGAVWAKAIDSVGIRLQLQKLNAVAGDYLGHEKVFRQSATIYSDRRDDRSRRSYESSLQTEATYNRKIASIHLASLGLTVENDINETFESAVTNALRGHTERVLQSLEAEINRFIPVEYRTAMKQTGIFKAFAAVVASNSTSALEAARRQTLCAQELSRVAKGRYLARVYPDRMSEKLAVGLRVGADVGWVYLAVVADDAATAKASEPIEMPDRSVIELVKDGYDVVMVDVKPEAIGFEVLSSVAKAHADLFDCFQHEKGASFDRESSGRELGLAG